MRCMSVLVLMSCLLERSFAVVLDFRPYDMKLLDEAVAQWCFTCEYGEHLGWVWESKPGLRRENWSRKHFIDVNRTAFRKTQVGDWHERLIWREAFALYLLEKFGVGWSPRLLWTNNEDELVVELRGQSVLEVSSLPMNLKHQLQRIFTDLYRLGIEHTDAKTEDLVVADGRISLIDFGTSLMRGRTAERLRDIIDYRPDAAKGVGIPDDLAMYRFQGLLELKEFLAQDRTPRAVGESSDAAAAPSQCVCVNANDAPRFRSATLQFSVDGPGEQRVSFKAMATGEPTPLFLTRKVAGRMKALASFMEGRQNVSVLDLSSCTGEVLFAMGMYQDAVSSRTLVDKRHDCIATFLRVRAWGSGSMWSDTDGISAIHAELVGPPGPDERIVAPHDVVAAVTAFPCLYIGSMDRTIRMLTSFTSPGGILVVAWSDPTGSESRSLCGEHVPNRRDWTLEKFDAALQRHCAHVSSPERSDPLLRHCRVAGA